MPLTKETERQYAASWKDFSHWCDERGHACLPAELSAVTHFLMDRCQNFSESTLRKRLLAIEHMHRTHDEPSPLEGESVSALLEDVATLAEFASNFNNDIAATLTTDERALLDACEGESTIDIRDRLLITLLIAFDLRRSIAKKLDFRDISVRGKELVLHSEIDSGRRLAGNRIRCSDSKYDPVRAFQAWIKQGGVDSGPIFRSVDRHGNVGSAMSEVAIYKVVRKRAEKAGLKDFSPMMLRSVPEK